MPRTPKSPAHSHLPTETLLSQERDTPSETARHRGKRPDTPASAAVEARRTLVAQGVLARKSVRAISRDLLSLPRSQRPSQCSPATVHRDVQALRDEWTAVRLAAMDTVLGEEIARLNALEESWWPRALAGRQDAGEATKHVLAIQKQRATLLQLGRSTGKHGALNVGAAAQDGALQLNIRWLDDWRSNAPTS